MYLHNRAYYLYTVRAIPLKSGEGVREGFFPRKVGILILKIFSMGKFHFLQNENSPSPHPIFLMK